MVNLGNMANPPQKSAAPSSPPVVASYLPQRVTTTVEIHPVQLPRGHPHPVSQSSSPPSSPVRPTAYVHTAPRTLGGVSSSSSSVRGQPAQVSLQPLPAVVGRIYPWPPESSGVSKTFYAAVNPRTAPVGVYTRNAIRRVLAPHGGWEALDHQATSPYPKGTIVGYQQLDTAVKFLCNSGQLTEPVVRIYLE